ncbi:MAG: sugar phosphate isomerase/epimerase [Bacteroidia bacterium]
MIRRNFLQLSAAAGAGISLQLLAPSCMIPAESPYRKNIGLQLYTVRDQMAADAAGTLKAIRDLGYYQVETSNTQLAKIKPLADDLGLVVKSSFVDGPIITGRWDLRGVEDPGITFESVVEEAHTHGISHIVFGYMMKGERTKLDDYRSVSDKLNAAGELCRQAGIQLCYHNHAFEFEPMEGSTGFDILVEKFDKDLVKFELDIFWSSLGGVEPVGLMEKLGSRLSLIHLKDKLAGTPVQYDESQVPKDAFKELGNGEVDIKGVLTAAEKYGVDYCMVEQDQSPDPINSIGVSLDFMKKAWV